MLLAFLVPSLVLHECVEVMLIGILIIIAFSIRVDLVKTLTDQLRSATPLWRIVPGNWRLSLP
jgi:hypothetical protein